MGLENPLHIAILLVVVLLVFGGKRLPDMARSLGSGIRGFKDELTGPSESTSQTLPPAPPQATAPTPAPAPAAAPAQQPAAPAGDAAQVPPQAPNPPAAPVGAPPQAPAGPPEHN